METKLPRTQHERGVALIITLFMLSLITVLIIGFVSSMITERRAAAAYEETQRAKLLAQGAVSHAIDILRTNIPEPARITESAATAPAENWVTNPGRLTVIKSGQQPVYIPLHTGEVHSLPPTGTPRDAESVDLNLPLPGQTAPTIAPTPVGKSTPPVMRVKWVNVLKNTAEPASADNRLTGRYAFWVDDESTRLNFNVALGKPANGPKLISHLGLGFMTPQFDLGDGFTTYGGGTRMYALGKPQSVNLDILLDKPAQLQKKKLLAHVFRHGYARHPEAIMDFVDVPDPKSWYEKSKFDLTFYNRSPEFNSFGLSRLFTTFVPLSLEAGPAYQHPFVHDPSDSYNGGTSEILQFNTLFGSFGFTATTDDEEGDGTVNSGNRIMRAQLDMMMDYLHRRWPGYTKSFVDKYGWDESAQIALNTLLMARMSTAQISNANLVTFTQEYGARTTSVNYSPSSDERVGYAPERFYWNLRNPNTAQNKLMLPQMSGPQAVELRLFVRAVVAPAGGANRHLEYYYETEYYAPPLSPVVDLSVFPTKMDYFRIAATGTVNSITQKFGIDAPNGTGQPNWNNGNNLGVLQVLPAQGTLLGPAGATHNGNAVPNRRVIRSAVFRLTNAGNPNRVSLKDDTTGTWTPNPGVFNANKDGVLTVDFQFRAGLGLKNMPPRPYQMIPLGEMPEDTLTATFHVDLKDPGAEQVYSWQINDPRLSHDKNQWIVTGPGDPMEIGTPGAENAVQGIFTEPSETSTEKSKFRYIQRAHGNSKVGDQPLDRSDEYTTFGRVSSPGYWSVLHTGMQNRRPWKTLDLRAESTQDSPPDWLLLDLFGATYPMAHDQWRIESTLPDEFSTTSFMNSTAGQVNVNSRIYPQTDFFQAPERTKPVEAVFKYLRSENEIKTLSQNIASYQTDTQVFDYIGELSNVNGFAGTSTTQWQQELLLRNMAGSLTTRTNTFGVWGVAQTVKKSRSNTQHDAFETGDKVQGEKRFYALIERYVWTGRDGVPGNAHVDTFGKWDRLAEQSGVITGDGSSTDTLFQLPGSPPLKKAADQTRLNLDATGSYPEFDGPEKVGSNPYTKASLGDVRYRQSTLEDAYNPPQAAIQYRVLYFKYLDQ